MREILFRGKRTDNGQWVEGSLSMVDTRSQKIGKKYGQMFICYVQTAWQNTKNGKLVGYWIEVNPETVGQFTGLLDKNGNKIFEGDVVKWGHVCSYWFEDPFIVAIVEFSPELSFNAVNIGSKYGFSNFIYQRTDKYLEKIGNIHDTPELL